MEKQNIENDEFLEEFEDEYEDEDDDFLDDDNFLHLEDIDLISEDVETLKLRLIMKDGTWKYVIIPKEIWKHGNTNK